MIDEGQHNQVLNDRSDLSTDLEEEILGHLDKIAALCAVQSLLAAEGVVPLLKHHVTYCRMIEEQVGELNNLLEVFMYRREQPA